MLISKPQIDQQKVSNAESSNEVPLGPCDTLEREATTLLSKGQVPDASWVTAASVLTVDAILTMDQHKLQQMTNMLKGAWSALEHIRQEQESLHAAGLKGRELHAKQIDAFAQFGGALLAFGEISAIAQRRAIPRTYAMRIDPKSQAARMLIDVSDKPGTASLELRDRLNIGDTQLSRTGRRLLKLGFVVRQRQGRTITWQPTPTGRAAAEELRKRTAVPGATYGR